MITAWVLSEESSFGWMLFMWVLMASSTAINLFDSPAATRRSISVSRSLEHRRQRATGIYGLGALTGCRTLIGECRIYTYQRRDPYFRREISLRVSVVICSDSTQQPFVVEIGNVRATLRDHRPRQFFGSRHVQRDWAAGKAATSGDRRQQ